MLGQRNLKLAKYGGGGGGGGGICVLCYDIYKYMMFTILALTKFNWNEFCELVECMFQEVAIVHM